MRDRTKPFVVYRRGPGSFTIMPRGWKGWAQCVAWLALLAPHIWWFSHYLEGHRVRDDYGYALALFCIGLLAWLIAGIWWGFAHGEVVDVVVLKRDRKRKERSRRRRGE